MPVRSYELMVILDPSKGEDAQQEVLGKIEEQITRFGGTPIKRDIIGKRRLSYSIQKRRDGYYAVLTFSGPSTSELLSEVERYCKYSEDILRSIVTLAVVGKSKGDPSLAEAALARQQAQSFNRGGPGGRGRRPDAMPEGAPAVAVADAPAPTAVMDDPAPAITQDAPAE